LSNPQANYIASLIFQEILSLLFWPNQTTAYYAKVMLNDQISYFSLFLKCLNSIQFSRISTIIDS